VLKRKVANYPEALRVAVVQDYLWQAELGLIAFAPKFAGRSGAYGTAACLARAVNQLLVVLFALNRKYLIDDKTALARSRSSSASHDSSGRAFSRRSSTWAALLRNSVLLLRASRNCSGRPLN
jgi:hypothetical protein